MTLMNTLDELQRLEVAMAQLYRWFTGLFADRHPEAAAVFFRLCIQEEGHASLIRYHRRLARSITGVSERADRITPEIRSAVEQVETFLQRSTPPTLAEAVEFAVAMEESAAERVHGTMAADHIGGSLVESLLDEDRRHRSILEQLRADSVRIAVA